LRETISRGKRQRIKKRLEFLNGESIGEQEEPAPTKVPLAVSAPAKIAQKPVPKEPKPQRMAPADKVATLLKKREDKEKGKKDTKHNKYGITLEDKEIIKKVKGKKKENKR
jgi:hypothetical protein